MYEPYLNREKQYLKMNAELDDRFKDFDQIKNDSSDIVKPRLNVFGNGSKTINQSARTLHIPKPKRSEMKCTTTPKTSSDVLLRSSQSLLSERGTSLTGKLESSDKKSTLKINPSDQLGSAPSGVINRTQEQTEVTTSTNNANVSPTTTNEVGVKRNISTDGLIK